MKDTLTCPNCLKRIEVKLIGTIKIVLMEGFTKDREGEYISPREKFRVKEDKIKDNIRFLLSNWADKVIVYDLNNKVLETYWK